MKKLLAEMLGTFWLVFGGCGSAMLAATFPEVGFGLVGVALAFGLTVVTMAYSLGHISGCHLNPAVTIGLWAGGRFKRQDVAGYVAAQIVGGIVAALVLYLIASGKSDFAFQGFASNGFGDRSPGRYNVLSVFLMELTMTFMFLIVIMGCTEKRAHAAFAPLAIGLCLTLIHLVSIPVSNTSVNPARSTGVALFAGMDALRQLWLFWLAPILGGVLGALTYKAAFQEDAKE